MIRYNNHDTVEWGSPTVTVGMLERHLPVLRVVNPSLRSETLQLLHLVGRGNPDIAAMMHPWLPSVQLHCLVVSAHGIQYDSGIAILLTKGGMYSGGICSLIPPPPPNHGLCINY